MAIRTRSLLSLLLALSVTSAHAQAPAKGKGPSPSKSATEKAPVAWRTARWGMTPKQVLAAFPKEARGVNPAVILDDGNTIEAEIPATNVEGLGVTVKFVFEAGKLALVSARTPQSSYSDAAVYEKMQKTLIARWGEPVEQAADSNFIDMRQTRWDVTPATRADLKYIPGVVAILLYPRPASDASAPQPAYVPPPAPAAIAPQGPAPSPDSSATPFPAPEPDAQAPASK